MIRAVLGVMALGGFLCYMGYQEHQVSKNTSDRPEPISLVKLEYGVDPPNNHIKIGDHVAIYEGLIYTTYDNNEPDAETPIEYVYYPILSMSHSFVKSLAELENGDPATLQERNEDLSRSDFKVIVKSCRFQRVGELPESLTREQTIRGLIVNQITSLDVEERKLLREEFPQLNLEELIILQEGRTPSSPLLSMGMMGGGALILASCMAGLVVFRGNPDW